MAKADGRNVTKAFSRHKIKVTAEPSKIHKFNERETYMKIVIVKSPKMIGRLISRIFGVKEEKRKE